METQATRRARQTATKVKQRNGASEADEALSPGTGAAVGDDAESSDPEYMTSLARGLAVIQAFGHQRASLTISQVSQWTGISRAAARRCLHTLEKLGFVGASEDRNYELRPMVMSLGYAYLSSLPFWKAARPTLKRVTQALDETASITVLDGDEIQYVARSSAERLMVINLQVGSRLPAYCTSPGRVLLSQLDDSEINARISRMNLVKRTPTTIVTPAVLRQELKKVRSQGYAVIDQELELGLRTIAVPILDSTGKAIAALSVGTHIVRASVAEMVERFLPVMKDAAKELGLLST